jgi:hypothetical protein
MGLQDNETLHNYLLLIVDLTDHLNVGPNCGIVEFTPQIGKQKQCVLIWIFSDDELEGNAEFTIQLHCDHPLVAIQNDVAYVTIWDNPETSMSHNNNKH